jgi:hypothetical protein
MTSPKAAITLRLNFTSDEMIGRMIDGMIDSMIDSMIDIA